MLLFAPPPPPSDPSPWPRVAPPAREPEAAEPIDFGTTDPNVEAEDWSGPPPDFGAAGAAAEESAAEAEQAAWEAATAERIKRMGPPGVMVAQALATMTIDGDRQLCEQLGFPWPGLSGPENAGNLEAARQILTQAWLETVALLWPKTSGKYSAPMLAVGAAAGGKVAVVAAARRRRRSTPRVEESIDVDQATESEGKLPWD